ncbi:MAG: hypothetical protein IJN04_07540 [Clostridia bacterium]|nr:hypothetical protein [Clostridia bacterium]
MKKLLSLLCVLTLLMGLVPATGAVTAAAARKTLYHDILARDGFIEGVWYPWFTHDNLGCGLTTNETAAKYITNGWYDFKKVGIDAYGAEKVYAEIYNLKAMGYNMLAYAGSAYGEGVIYDDNGDVVGIKQEYLDNTRRFLSICRDVGMPIMWNIYFHCSSVPDYYGMDAWNMMCRMLGDNTVADHYAQRFVKPLCKVLGEFDDVVALIALTDEVENEINDPDDQASGVAKGYGATKEDVHYFVKAMNDVVKKEVPQIARTIAANSDDLGLYSDIEMDVMGRNRYSDNGDAAKLPDMYPTAPMLLTEYNLASASGKSEADFSRMHIAFRDSMKQLSYHGGFQWCWQPNAKGNVHDLLAKSATTTTDFRPYMYDRYYYTKDALYAYQGKTPALEAPSLFYHTGNGLLEWIPSRGGKTVTIESSANDGKTWRPVADGLLQDDLVTDGKCVYQVRNADANAMYRVTVKDAAGHTAAAVTNRAGAALDYMAQTKTVTVTRFYRPSVVKADVSFASSSALSLTSFGNVLCRPQLDAYNEIDNGSFEKNGGGQWNYSSFLSSAVQVVTDKTAPSGSKSLHFDTRGTTAPKWYTFKVTVRPHTEYTLSAWVKGAHISDNNRFYGSFGVLNPATKTFATYSSYSGRRSREDQQIYPTAWDDDWHLRSVTFNSGNRTEVVLGLYGYGSEMWLDDIALFAQGSGVAYLSDIAKGIVSQSYDYEYLRCDPAKSVTENVRFDDGKSTYWQSGGGWDNGFLRIADAPNGYGKAMKYTASANPKGVSYVKEIAVKKHTAYVVTIDYKVVEEGAGRFGLAVRKGDGICPIVFLEMSGTTFYEDENGWCTFSTKLNMDVFDRLLLYVTDLGGEAYIDNVRVFLPQDGSNVSDVAGGNSGTTAPVVRPTATPSAPTAATRPVEGSSTTLPTPTATHPTEGAAPDTGTTLPTGESEPTDAPSDGVPDTPTNAGGKESFPSVLTWVIIGAAALIAVGGGVTILVLVRRKKKSTE